MDASGRLYMAYSQSGCGVKCFKKVSGNWYLDWDVMDMHFVDVCDIDPASDGRKMYGLQEIYDLDMTKTTPGTEWKLSGYTLDAYRFPADGRGMGIVKEEHEHGLTTAWIRYINGKRFLFGQGMTCQWLPIWKFEDNSNIARPSAFLTLEHRIYDVKPDLYWPPNIPGNPYSGIYIWRDLNNDADYQANEYVQTNTFQNEIVWIDYSGNIWSSNGSAIWKKSPNGLDANGNPIYDDAHTTTYNSGLTGINKLVYLDDRDIMVMNTGGECRNLGTIHVFSNFTKSNKAELCSFVPHQNDMPGGLAAAGDYIFTGWNWHGGATGFSQVWVYSLTTGAYVGRLDPGTETMQDIGYGITAFKRSNGEYLVNIEDDGLGKCIMYRWCPSGNCGQVAVQQFNRSHGASAITGKGNGERSLYSIDGRIINRGVADGRVRVVIAQEIGTSAVKRIFLTH